MGDPISTFGVAAGAIQLTDLALRASREAYGFLSAVKDSERDVRNLKDSQYGTSLLLVSTNIQE